MSEPSRRSLVLAALVMLVFGTGPTVGDVGSCGQAADDLDPRAFFAVKKETDCRRCRDCGLATRACADACASDAPAATTFPATCRPLVHDGEVCLHALDAASCADYETYQADQAATAPTECQFCPL